MSTTVLGDTDMTLMRVYFVKPQAAIAMSFSDDPQMGWPATVSPDRPPPSLTTQSFVLRTASLR